MDKKTVLLSAFEAREQEIFHYQIDIDNFQYAIKKIDNEYQEDADLSEFRQHLCNLLASNLREQKKAIIIRDVIRDQLNGLETP